MCCSNCLRVIVIMVYRVSAMILQAGIVCMRKQAKFCWSFKGTRNTASSCCTIVGWETCNSGSSIDKDIKVIKHIITISPHNNTATAKTQSAGDLMLSAHSTLCATASKVPYAEEIDRRSRLHYQNAAILLQYGCSSPEDMLPVSCIKNRLCGV